MDLVVWREVKKKLQGTDVLNSKAFGKHRPLLLHVFYEHFNR